jgi:hypothetical protein
MTTGALFIPILITLLALGIAIWFRIALAKVEEELRAFTGFTGMHFDS